MMFCLASGGEMPELGKPTGQWLGKMGLCVLFVSLFFYEHE
jgi:hypothetical protein